jgi:hypothetical protein
MAGQPSPLRGNFFFQPMGGFFYKGLFFFFGQRKHFKSKLFPVFNFIFKLYGGYQSGYF